MELPERRFAGGATTGGAGGAAGAANGLWPAGAVANGDEPGTPPGCAGDVEPSGWTGAGG
jgi:hypothetical protein